MKPKNGMEKTKKQLQVYNLMEQMEIYRWNHLLPVLKQKMVITVVH